MDCPRCKSPAYCKSGFAKGRQCYKCNACNYHYTLERKSSLKSSVTKDLALKMYLGSMTSIFHLSFLRRQESPNL